MLVYGAATLVLGLATYGYNIMAVLGNRITLHSPSRGFCMELGGAITVILVGIASPVALPEYTRSCNIAGISIRYSSQYHHVYHGSYYRVRHISETIHSFYCLLAPASSVSLCNGDIRSTNWKAIAWIYVGWILTIIVVAVASACMLAIVINAPRLN